MLYYHHCFNPYFNGFTTLTLISLVLTSIALWSFNPYFNGFTTLTYFMLGYMDGILAKFQSLF